MYVARKPMTVLGTRYRPGQPVDLDEVPPVLRRRLVEQRRVVPRASGASADPAVPVKTCGDHGGRTNSGEPCKVATDGLCARHRN